MKKILCLLICAFVLYSCSDDSNPTGNDFSDMKFESVSIKVQGMKYSVINTLKPNITPWSDDCYFYLFQDSIKPNKLIYNNGIYSYDSSYSYSAAGGSDSYANQFKFKLNKVAKVIDSLWASYYSSSSYNHVAFSNSSSESKTILLVNLPYSIDSTGSYVVDIANTSLDIYLSAFSQIIYATAYNKHEQGNPQYNYENRNVTTDLIGYTDNTNIKIVLTPAK